MRQFVGDFLSVNLDNYLRKHPETAQTLQRHEDGYTWLHTGDLGWLDEGGNLHISGRKKDIIIRNGNNISARKIEEALQSLPGVAYAAVVGIPNARMGEVPCALVVPRSGFRLTEESLLAQLQPILAKNELPDTILFRDALPLTASGKPDKQTVKTLFIQ
jgi:acyl-CoA synthetase (AMP-forming)/AMP-acid ligase II